MNGVNQAAARPLSAWADFWRGATQPNLMALAVAGGVALAVLALCVSMLDRDWVARYGARYLSDNPVDFDAAATAETLALQAAAPSKVAVILGSSQLAVAVLRDPFEAHLRQASRGAPPVYKLTSPRQSLLDAFAIADSIPAGAAGIAVIGLSPGRFAHDPRSEFSQGVRYRLGVRSGVQDQELARAGLQPTPMTGIFAIDARDFLLARRKTLLRNLIRGNPRALADWDLSIAPPLSREAVLTQVATLRERYGSYWRMRGENRERFERLLDRLDERTDLRILLVGEPLNPLVSADPAIRAIIDDHEDWLRQLSARRGVVYRDLNAAGRFQAGDFRDWSHLHTADAIAWTTRYVAEEAAALLAATGAP